MESIWCYATGVGAQFMHNSETVPFSKVKTGKWIGNNRRTDYWFKKDGAFYHGWCGENTTAFLAKKIKGN